MAASAATAIFACRAFVHRMQYAMACCELSAITSGEVYIGLSVQVSDGAVAWPASPIDASLSRALVHAFDGRAHLALTR